VPCGLHAECLLHGLDFVGRGGGVDQHGLGQMTARKGECFVDARLAARSRERVDTKRRTMRAPRGHLGVGRLRRAAGQHRGMAFDARQRVRVVAFGQEPGATETRGQAERDAGAAGHERQVRARFAEHVEIAVCERVRNREAHAFGAQLVDGGPHGRGAQRDRRGTITALDKTPEGATPRRNG